MKKIILIVLLSISLIVAIISLSFKIYDLSHFKYKAWQDGDTSKWQAYLNDNTAYELGLDYQGKPIFKNPEKAFKQIKKDYEQAIKIVKKQYNLPFNLNKYNFKKYNNLSWQIQIDNDTELYHDCLMLSYALSFYENSLKTD